MMFRHLESGDGPHSIEYLSNAWDFSFKHAMSVFDTPTVTPDGTIQLPVLRQDEIVHSQHKDLLGLWNPQLWKVLGSPMEHFVPMTSGISDSVRRFSDEIFSSDRDDAIQGGGKGAATWYCMSSIVLATVYAVACKSISTVPEPDQRVQVAFPPHLLFSRKPHQWAVSVGGAINGVISCVEWTKMMLEVCTAVEFPRSVIDGNHHNDTREYPSQARSAFTDIFGAQANGIIAVADFLLNPSTNPTSLATFHVERGQSLHLPCDSSGLMKVSTFSGQIHMIALDPEPEHTVLESRKSEVTVRVDVAPDWDHDPQTIAFHVRVDGIHRYTLSPYIVAQRVTKSVIGCRCLQFKSSLEVPLDERWQPVSMSQFFVPTFRMSSPSSRFGVEVGNYVLVQAGGDRASQLLCLGVMEGHSVILATKCLDCAYRKLFLTAAGRSYKPHEAILINGLL